MTRDTFAQKMCGGASPKEKILLDGLPSKGGNSSKGIFHVIGGMQWQQVGKIEELLTARILPL